MLKQSCISGINPTWSWCIILFIYCWIQFGSVFEDFCSHILERLSVRFFGGLSLSGFVIKAILAS
jgi:hypothetical protein